jgi:hypothetical protein
MKRNESPALINIWTVLGALAVAGCLLLSTLVAIGWFQPHAPGTVGFLPADLTIIAAPTATVLVPTPTPGGTLTPAPGQIAIGLYVQITGTGGDGLRIHSAPGLNSNTVFRGEESETFIVKDGPKVGDGYTWWYLVAPYDNTRVGWAAANFLGIVPSP